MIGTALTQSRSWFRSQPRQQPQHRRLRHRHAAGGRPEILARQMQEYRAAAAGDARRGVVIDLDDEIIEVVVAPEPVAAADADPAASAGCNGGLRGLRTRRPRVRMARTGKKRARPRMAVGAPPQLPRPEDALGVPPSPSRLLARMPPRPSATGIGLSARGQPAPAGIAGGGANPDRRQRPISRDLSGKSFEISSFSMLTAQAPESLHRRNALFHAITGHSSKCPRILE